MFYSLEGTIKVKNFPVVVLDVNGIGFEVTVPFSTYTSLPDETGERCTLFTYFHLAENMVALYGFSSITEKKVFLHLLDVPGIGPKFALNILSHLRPEELYRCLKEGNAGKLTKIRGIGQKTAERIILELKDRLKFELEPETTDQCDMSEIEKALESLGFTGREIEKAVISLRKDPSFQSKSLEELIVLGIQLIKG